MGFLKLFRAKPKTDEMPLLEVVEQKISVETDEMPLLEVVEQKISVEFGRHQVRVRTLEKEEMYLEEYLWYAGDPKYPLEMSRFYLIKEHPWGLHFATTLEQALDWFKGRNNPHDGFLSISWGNNVTYQCGFCQHQKIEPLHVTKVEKVILSGDLPFNWEIEGYRVSEVETKQMGKGHPSKIIGLKIHPVIKWYSEKRHYICQACADRLKAIGQQDKLIDYSIF